MDAKCVFLLALAAIVGGCVTQPVTPPNEGASASPIDRVKAQQLNPSNLAALLEELFPKRDYAVSYAFDGFLVDLRHFGIHTIEELRRIITENLAFAEREEAKSFEMVKQIHAAAKGGPNTVIARGYYYNSVGMARNALRNHVGDAIYSDYEMAKSGFIRESEKPNKAPEPTPTAVTPRAMEVETELKQWIVESNEARGAPAAVVAHL